NSAGNSGGWSAAISFAIGPPTPPTLTAPAGSSSNTMPTFTWTASVGATRYDLWVSNLSTGQNQFIRQQNLTTTSFTNDTALPVGSYQAWVQALSSNGSSAGWSAGLSFSIVANLPPAAPTLTGPATTITTTTPTFTWTAPDRATQYDLWADNTTTGQSQ